MGKLVVIEGTDGSGKSTQFRLLSERLETQAVYICRGSISRIEDKSRTVTDIELMGLAKVLGVKIQDLFE